MKYSGLRVLSQITWYVSTKSDGLLKLPTFFCLVQTGNKVCRGENPMRGLWLRVYTVCQASCPGPPCLVQPSPIACSVLAPMVLFHLWAGKREGLQLDRKSALIRVVCSLSCAFRSPGLFWVSLLIYSEHSFSLWTSVWEPEDKILGDSTN